MRYVALLRGINVGGANKIDMKELRSAVEATGMSHVRTYINSGNVIFEAHASVRPGLAGLLEATVEKRFGTVVRVLVKSHDEIRSVVAALPDEWKNDADSKCDVFFLWPSADNPSVLDALDFDEAIDDVRYTPGAVLRRVAQKHASRSKLTRIVGTPLYQEMTVRNCNTARKLLELLDQ